MDQPKQHESDTPKNMDRQKVQLFYDLLAWLHVEYIKKVEVIKENW